MVGKNVMKNTQGQCQKSLGYCKLVVRYMNVVSYPLIQINPFKIGVDRKAY